MKKMPGNAGKIQQQVRHPKSTGKAAGSAVPKSGAKQPTKDTNYRRATVSVPASTKGTV